MLTSLHDPFDARIFSRESVSLARAGHEVTLVAPHRAGERRDGVQVLAVAVPRNRAERMTRTAWDVWRAALALDADVYHFHDFELIPGALFACARGRRVVYDMHEDFPRTFSAKTYLPAGLVGPIASCSEWFEDLASRRFAAIVAATPAIAVRALRLNPRTVVVRNFPRPEEFPVAGTRDWAARDMAVAYIGSIAANRGMMEMLEAMTLLAAAPGVTLRLAGVFETAELRRDAERHAGWRTVEDHGFLDRAGVSRLLSTVRAGLVLLHPEPRYQVAWPVKLFEYMAAGLPVVASDFPLWRGIVEDAGCGIVVDPLDPAAIAAAVRHLLSEPGEAEAMGRRGRAAVLDRFTWQSEEAKLLELYTQLEGARP